MAHSLSKFVTKNNIIGAGVLGTVLWVLSQRKKTKTRTKRPEEQIEYMITEKTSKKTKAHVNAVFFKQLKALLGLVIPGVWSTESAFLLLVAVSLVCRSYCDLWMIQNGTLVESAIVNMDRPLFKKRLLKYFAAMPVISIVNNVLKWSIAELKLRMRTNMTQELYKQYLNGFTYYKMSNLDNRIANADQLLTTDIDKFCETVADLYGNISKPILDIIIYVYRLTTNLGGQTPGLMLIYLLISGVFLTHLRRPTGRMTVTEQKLEGEFRYVNSRLITNSEEIAFYNGNHRERLTLLASFSKLTAHLRKFLEFRVMMGVVDNIVAKYVATVVGFYAVSMPFFTKDHPLLSENRTDRFRHYYTYGRMLVKLAEAIGRLVLAGREMTRLAGFTARVTELINVLNDLNKGHYVRTMVNGAIKNEVTDIEIKPGGGHMVYKDNVIIFDRVPLVTPNGDVLVKELSFTVISGTNVLVCGPNGCGKSSLFRILGELWPLWGGTMTKPPAAKLFYIPQRPYMTLGTLRDQVIYPHTREQMRRRGRSDSDLDKYLELVQLSYLQTREKGWDAVEDWIDVLSGGEKQRIAMARLFYHNPQFAILDECTSAVSVDVEGSMYQYCREANITLFTVSHRKSLWKHHEHVLKLDGRGNYTFGPIEGDTEEFGS